MKKALVLIPVFLIGMLPSTVGLVAAETAPQTVRGELGIAEEDDDGNVSRVYVYDLDRGSVLIADTDKGRELLRHLGATVKVKGSLAESDDPAYDWVIDVMSFEVQDLDEDDPDDPGDR